MTRQWVATIAVAAGGVLLSACAGTPSAQPAPTPSMTPPGSTSTPSAAPSSPSSSSPVSPSASPADDALTLTITLTGNQVSPNAERFDVRRGQTVVLNVTSDHPDEIHAHTAGDGFTLAVQPGKRATGRFVASDAGSFEVESHESGKVIAILNVR